MKRVLGVLLVLVPTLLFGCGDDDEAGQVTTTAGSFPLSIKQTDGETLTLNGAPQRIVSLAPNATEILCVIGAGDQLAAVEKFENCPAGSSAKPSIDAFQPNLEAIAAYRPDLVYTTFDPSGLVESLRRLNIPVLYLDVPADLAGVYDQIALFGDLSGHRNEADELVAAMRKRHDAVLSKLGKVSGPRIYHELDNTYYTAAPHSFVGDFYKTLKASNIAEGALTAYPQLSAEVILQRNPEVIVLADEAAGVDAGSVKARPGWHVIDAVRNSRICSIDPDLVSRPGPRIVDALEKLAKCLYPDQF
jgi:iron complex transport system substrate-binding protein